MTIKTLLTQLASLKKGFDNTEVNLVLINGNITLRGFILTNYDDKKNTVQGLTKEEAYSYLREEREPMYATFDLSEIKTIEQVNSPSNQE